MNCLYACPWQGVLTCLLVCLLTDPLLQKLLQGPIGIGIGLVFGYLYGMLLHYLPSRNAVSMAATEYLYARGVLIPFMA